ncbi:MAG: hypothetical protein ACTSWY_13090, partial [Promethearchaeota archaeon]
GKSFGISLIIYIALNFVMNMLLVLAAGSDLGAWFGTITTEPYTFISSLFVVNYLMPPGTGIMLGLSGGITQLMSSDPFNGIMSILIPIVPGLIAAIVAGTMADGAKQAFFGWFLTAIISVAVPLIFHFIEPSSVAMVLFLILSMVSEMWEIIVFTLLIGIFNGMLWGSVAALIGAEY